MSQDVRHAESGLEREIAFDTFDGGDRFDLATLRASNVYVKRSHNRAELTNRPLVKRIRAANQWYYRNFVEPEALVRRLFARVFTSK